MASLSTRSRAGAICARFLRGAAAQPSCSFATAARPRSRPSSGLLPVSSASPVRLLSASQQRRTLATALERDDTYAKLTGAHITALASRLSSPSTSLLTTIAPEGDASGVQVVDADELAGFNVDWMNKYKGQSQCVIKPKNTEEVSAVMRYCHEQRLAVVPQGGNTGLVGGSVPVFDEVIVNLSNLNKVRSFDEVSGTLVADAGCILEALDNHIADKGYMMPLDLGAKGR